MVYLVDCQACQCQSVDTMFFYQATNKEMYSRKKTGKTHLSLFCSLAHIFPFLLLQEFGLNSWSFLTQLQMVIVLQQQLSQLSSSINPDCLIFDPLSCQCMPKETTGGVSSIDSLTHMLETKTDIQSPVDCTV